MPCNDGGAPISEDPRYRAMLCGIVTVLSKEMILTRVLDAVDWREAGVSREAFELWWSSHQRQDAQRRRQEADDRQRDELRKSAREKLTPAERHALGL